MTSVRLCLPADSDLEIREEGVVVDRCLPASVCHHPAPLGVPVGVLAEHCSATPAEDYIAVSVDRHPTGTERIVPLVNALSPDEALTIHQQSAVPVSLLEMLPETVWGFLQRPQVNDICCLPRAVVESAGAEVPTLPLWLQHGAFSASVLNPPASERFPGLGPGHPVVPASLLKSVVRNCSEVNELGPGVSDLFLAGVLLVWDCLEESHSLSQQHDSGTLRRTADYWHGLMHRREPDPGNAAYWFRRVGRHPAMSRLHEHLSDWLQEIEPARDNAARIPEPLHGPDWDPLAMIRLCSETTDTAESDDAAVLRQIQYLEMLNLLAEPWF